MKPIKRLFTICILSLISLAILSQDIFSQDIFFMISGEYENSKVSVDSIQFENLSNQTSLNLKDLPDKEEYIINLTTQEIVELTGINAHNLSDNFKVLKNMPGQLVISYDTKDISGSSIDIYNVNGQKIYTSSLLNIAGNGSVRLNTGTNAMYFVKLHSVNGSKVFKAVSGKNQGILEIYLEQSPSGNRVNRKSTLIANENNFSVELGDSLLVSAYKDTLLADPVEVIVEENNTVEFTFKAEPIVDTTTVTDIDGNIYQIVHIGEQVWMAENLKTSTLSDGTSIPDTSFGASIKDPGYGWYVNDSATYSPDYGALYNWYAVETEKLCPAGWHVPDDYDWNQLLNFLGGGNVAGDKLKESGTVHWDGPNNGTNESGFTALPGGVASSGGSMGIGGYAYYWSASTLNDTSAWYWHLWYNYGGIAHYYDNNNMGSGMSVRCLKDNEITGHIPSVITIDPVEITDTSAMVGGNVYDDGGSSITETGVYWGTVSNPKSSGTKLSIGSSKGIFSSLLSGLSHSTTYYIQSYAVNEFGEALGSEVSFSTSDSSGTALFLKINENEYDLKDGLIAYYGNFELTGIHNHSIYLMSSGHNMNWETLESTGSGAVLNFEMFNTQSEIASGEYPFSLPEIMNTILVQDTTICDGTDTNGDGIVNEDDCFHSVVYTMPEGGKYISSRISAYDSNTNLNDLTGLKFDSGTITITRDGDTYIFEIDCTGENGDIIKGYYEGPLHYYDFSEF